MTMGDILVIGVLVLVIVLIVRGMIRDRKKGKCCGCSGCSGCPSRGACSGSCNGCIAMKKD